MTPFILLGLAAVSGMNEPAPDPSSTAPLNCYFPVGGGWRIVLTEDEARPKSEPPSSMGVPQDDARQHRRPLYPPADRTMLWNEEELAATPPSRAGRGGELRQRQHQHPQPTTAPRLKNSQALSPSIPRPAGALPLPIPREDCVRHPQPTDRVA